MSLGFGLSLIDRKLKYLISPILAMWLYFSEILDSFGDAIGLNRKGFCLSGRRRRRRLRRRRRCRQRVGKDRPSPSRNIVRWQWPRTQCECDVKGDNDQTVILIGCGCAPTPSLIIHNSNCMTRGCFNLLCLFSLLLTPRQVSYICHVSEVN